MFSRLPVAINCVDGSADDERSEYEHTTKDLDQIACRMQRIGEIEKGGLKSNKDLSTKIDDLMGEATEELFKARGVILNKLCQGHKARRPS